MRPPLRHEVFVTGCYSAFNKDLAIIKLELPVHKGDFDLLTIELKSFFSEIHEVRVDDVEQCPFGRCVCSLW